MRNLVFWSTLLVGLLLAGNGFPIHAQVPTGIISGTVTDASGAVIPNASVTITNKATGASRKLTVNAAGLYSAPSLEPGDYEVRVESEGFRTVVQSATVQAGGNLTVNAGMTVGATREVVTVEASATQINYDTHTVAGVIGRENIQDLPINGRDFIALASLEPGVTVTPATTSQFNTTFNVSILGGSSSRTYVTVDGGSIQDQTDLGISMNFSQEVVQEFQLSSVNFDVSTGITGVGAINIVTRGGTNNFHGSAYFYYRDHDLAAYPGLVRQQLDLHPFFARRNPGFWLGGPILRNKLFFFFNYEYQSQEQAVVSQATLPSVAG